MKKTLFFLAFAVLIAGCTQTTGRQTASDLQSAEALNLSLMVSDGLEIRRNTLFSGEMTRLTLNLLNYAEVDFNDVRVRLINADDLSPKIDYDYIEFVQPNRTNSFEWDLTAPSLGIGEILVLDDIRVRLYYDTYSTALKSIMLKAPGDRSYSETFEESSKSPIKLYFDTSYESVSTLPNEEMRNFTVNLVLYNEYIGVVDYYNNSYYKDNYIKSVVLGVPVELEFHNYYDENSPWKLASVSDAERLNIDSNSMPFYNYYYVEFNAIEDYGINYGFNDLCSLMTFSEEELEAKSIDELKSVITNQKRVLWMTKGYTKINVLRFGANEVDFDTELMLRSRIDYSYSQDFGGKGFGAIVYGTG